MREKGQLGFSFLEDRSHIVSSTKNFGFSVSFIEARSLLCKTGISAFDYVINCYRGCSFGCLYCYASFVKKFTAHREEWGEFVDVKINAIDVLRKEIKRINRGKVFLSSVTDPYLPVEAQFKLTRGVLEVMVDTDFDITILTKSPLVVRDTDILKKLKSVEVGFSIPTDREDIRKVFEPNATPLMSRIRALERLKCEGIRTYVFIAPLLPLNPYNLAKLVSPVADYVIWDSLSYPWKVSSVLKQRGLGYVVDPNWINRTVKELKEFLGEKLI